MQSVQEELEGGVLVLIIISSPGDATSCILFQVKVHEIQDQLVN